MIFNKLSLLSNQMYEFQFNSYFSDPPEEINLIEAITVPFEDSASQYFATGINGYPAFGFRGGASVKHPSRVFMPEKLFSEFSVSKT